MLKKSDFNLKNVVVSLVVAVVVAFLAVLIVGGLLKSSRVHTELGIFETSREAPEFDLVDTSGTEISLSDLKGKVVLLDFFSSWCVECAREAPELVSLHNELKEEVEFIGIAIWDNLGDLNDFVERHSISFPVVLHEGVLQTEYGVTGIPEKILINKEGQITAQIVGKIDEERLKLLIKNLL